MTDPIPITDISVIRNFSEIDKMFWEVIINAKTREQAEALKAQILQNEKIVRYAHEINSYSNICDGNKWRNFQSILGESEK